MTQVVVSVIVNNHIKGVTMKFNRGDRFTIAGIFCEVAFATVYGQAYMRSLVDSYYDGKKIEKDRVFTILDHNGVATEGFRCKRVN